MTWPRFRFAFAAVFLIASTSLCQGPASKLAPIAPLLINQEPRDVALGAWEVNRRQDDSFLPTLEQLVERWDPAQRHRLDDPGQFDAMTVILDTLIERNAAVSPAGVAAISYGFPDQALILAARLPEDDAEPLLLAWYENGQHLDRTAQDAEGANQLMLARVSAMMLTKMRPQTIAASLLASSVERLVVSVPNQGASGVERCIAGCNVPPKCAEEPVDEPQPGWPPIFQYTLEESTLPGQVAPRGSADPLRIEEGGDRITYRRVRAEVHLNYCRSPQPLNAETRHHLLAAMLGINDRRMPWAIQMDLTLPWQFDQQFLSELGTEVEQEQARLLAATNKYHSEGLITESQVELSRPRLAVVVFDDRQPTQSANTPLPQLAVRDARTTARVRLGH
jgi:hypothetical protein